MNIFEKMQKRAALKKQLQQTDYKIIKCYEYELAGEEPPYDMKALHTERQALRDEINGQEQEENGGADH